MKFLTLFRSARSLPTANRIFSRSLSNPSPSPSDGKEELPPKPFSEMPGTSGLPFIGNAFQFYKTFIKDKKCGEEDLFHQLQMKYGPIYRLRIYGNVWFVVTSSPEVIETMYRAEGKYPSRGPAIEANMTWIYEKINHPTPMFISFGEKWKRIRSAASKQVIPRRVGNFVEPLSDIADEFVAHLGAIKDESGDVYDLQPELNKWAFQGVSYFVYGEKIDLFSGTIDADQKEFMEAGLDYIRSLDPMTAAPPIYKYFPTKQYREFVKIVKRLKLAGKKILDRRYNEIKDAISSGHVDETKPVGLLDQWLIEGKFTEEEALSQSYDMLSAGIDTTTNTAALLIYEIAKHPELQERLVQEISSVVGDKKHPTWDDLQKMTLVRNCVKESMRLTPPGPINLRSIPEDTVLMGYHVPAGTFLAMNMTSMSRDSQIFKDPRKYDPDRWNKDSSEETHPFSSLPFGFGPRSCYGRRLAELEMYILLCRMLPKYRISTNIQEMKLKLITVVGADIPVQINFSKW